MDTLEDLNEQIINCRLCPRLVQYREEVARTKVRRFRDQDYWGRPIPGFGDPEARLLIVGLAPAAHGGNRTGRTFTGDRSGDWLYGALYDFGFASQPTSVSRDDGLGLRDCYIDAAVRCAPPCNKPTPLEFANCRPYLQNELQLLTNLKVVLALGHLAFTNYLIAIKSLDQPVPGPAPKFAHGAVYHLKTDMTASPRSLRLSKETSSSTHTQEIVLLASYHPSQQNTQTGRLTREMFYSVFRLARDMLFA